ncbi:hypothetical protein T03_14139 [Trichinella britovi]|uniref:Uncharacterized protein n=1 Tax=Trichinella britovi TaxID=45882 RepID=A0A0V1C3Z0_TRIBR|nr:hypothetical protein T03_14139 [Trichinella britovi]
MNEIAAFFGNYPLLNMWCFYEDSKSRHHKALPPVDAAQFGDVRIHFSSGFRDSVKGNIAK